MKNKLSTYILLEKQIIENQKAGNLVLAKQIFEGEGAVAFQNSVIHLNELAKIQSDVGSKLMLKSKTDFSGFAMLSFLQIALAVVLGLIILVLIKNSRIINDPKILKTKGQNFHMN